MAITILDVSCDAQRGIVTVLAGDADKPTKVASATDISSQSAIDAIVDRVRQGPLVPGANMYVGEDALRIVPDRPSPAHEWSWVTLAWVAELENMREYKIATLKRARDAVEFSPFTYDGHVLDGDEAAQRRLNPLISAAKSALAAGYSFTKDFTLADNSIVVFAAEDFVGIEMAKIWQVEEAFTKYRTLRAAAMSAATLTELEQIVW